MKETLKLLAFLVPLLSVGLYSMWCLAKTSGRIHDTLKNYRTEAENALNRAGLLGVRKKLCAFARKECVLRVYGDHARTVLAYVDGKLGVIPSPWRCPTCGAPTNVALMRNRHLSDTGANEGYCHEPA